MQNQVEIEDVDPGIEKLIVTGMIVSDKFLGEIYHAAKGEYFKGDITGTVAEWCREYFAEHKKAPKASIREVVIVKEGTEVEDQDDTDFLLNIKDFLDTALSEYSPTNFNSEYILSKALPYLEINSISVRIKMIEQALKRNDSDEALKILRDSAGEIFHEMSKPSDVPNIPELIEMYRENKVSIMNFPGAIGKYLNPLRRAKMVAMLGPTKRGKSHWLIEWALQGVLSGLKVIIFSLELTKAEMLELLVMRWTNQEIEEDYRITEKVYLVPVFDCLENQSGMCEHPDYIGTGDPVIDVDTGLPEPFEEHKVHVVCAECRGHIDKEIASNFKISSWFEEITRPVLKEKDLHRFAKEFEVHSSGGALKIQAFPISTATMEDVEYVLDKEEVHNGWVADMIIIDSADNFKKNLKLGDKRFQLGDIWEQISRVTKTRNTLTVTATQGNRGSSKKDRLELEDIAEDFSKAMTLDALFAINERGHANKKLHEKDKYWKRQQIETLASRYKGFIAGAQIMVLQNFQLGQILLDSEFTWYTPIGGGGNEE